MPVLSAPQQIAIESSPMKIPKVIDTSTIDFAKLDLPHELFLDFIQTIQSLQYDAETIRNTILLFDVAEADFHTQHRLLLQRDDAPDSQILADAKEKSHIFNSWQRIAASGNLSAFYNFAYSLSAMIDFFRTNPCDSVDQARLAEAMNDFGRNFPKVILARHANAHRAEIAKNRENTFRGKKSAGPIRTEKGASYLASDILINRTLQSTRKGEILNHDITWENFDKVKKILQKVISSFPQL